jgi:hypothetical protein
MKISAFNNVIEGEKAMAAAAKSSSMAAAAAWR